ncbi:MAG: PqqD family protein [Candidatus Contendobacter sp.]|nr:PqqD family protein [Candidatus Contendobacter sp.]
MLFPEQLLNPLVAVLKSDRLTYTDMGEDGGVLLDIAGHQVLTLNEVGMYLVNLIRQDDVGAAERLTQRLVAEFQVDEATARADVDQFLSELARFLGVSQ